jgi:hypothetical protein
MTGYVYVLCLDPPRGIGETDLDVTGRCQPISHYVGKPESSRFLNGICVLWSGEFAELTGCIAGGCRFSAAKPFAEVAPAELAPNVELGGAYGSTADREACVFQDIQGLCGVWAADSQEVVNVPGVIGLGFRRADHDVDVLTASCEWMHCRDHLVHEICRQQRSYELHAFFGDCPGPEYGL